MQCSGQIYSWKAANYFFQNDLVWRGSFTILHKRLDTKHNMQNQNVAVSETYITFF